MVSSSIQEEILLSWKALQRLGVISRDFPHIGIRACGVRSSGDEVLARRQEKVKYQPSRSHIPMGPGDKVIAQNRSSKRWDAQATIISRRRNRRSYLIDIDGREHVRNRRFLRPHPIPEPPDAVETGPTKPTTTQRCPKRVGKHWKVRFDHRGANTDQR